MAGNSVEFRVVVNADGLVTGLKQVTNFGNETQKTGKKAKVASDEVGHLNYTMNQGVVGASSAARSFSKLNQTIGSGGGLVGAYATLAANAFAVSAAFNALREASQVEQLMQGLEFQGAKTGRTLSTVAQSIREITEGSISAADAMRVTALGSSAGLTAGDLEKLTQVATNASKVLGRNLPDSMDRIIKGVTKLEPELLDELGLMTKLTEASEAYARQQGKSASALTNFEKRRAFVAAIQREGELKFGGVEEAVDVNQYDKLAATFQDLAQTSLAWLNSLSPLQGLLKTLTDSTLGMAGALLLFGSTIRRQLIGTFADITVRANNAAKATRDAAESLKTSAKAGLAASRGQLQVAAQELKTAEGLSKKAPTAFKANINAMIAGTASANQYKEALAALSRSSKYYENQVKKTSGAQRIAAQEEYAANQLRIKSVDDMKKAQDSAVKSEKGTKAARLEAIAAQRQAIRQEAVAGALSASSSGQVGTAFKEASRSIRAYISEQKFALQATVASAQAAGTSVPILANLQNQFKILAAASITARTAIFGLGLAVKMVGVAALSIMPYIGALFAFISIGEMIYKKYFETDADRQKKKALEELGQVLETTTAKTKEYERALASEAQAGARSIQANINRANTALELVQSLIKLGDAELEAAKKKQEADRIRSAAPITSGVPSNLAPSSSAGLSRPGRDPVAEKAATLIEKEGFANSALTGEFAKTLDLANKEQLNFAKGLVEVSLKYPKFGEEILKVVKSKKDFASQERALTPLLKAQAPAIERQRNAFENLQAQLKTTGEVKSAFTRGLRVTTPYDELAINLNLLTGAFKEVEFAASQLKEKVDMKDLVTAIPAEVSGAFSITAQQALETFNIIDTNIQGLKAELPTLDAKSPKFKETQAALSTLQTKRTSLQEYLLKALPEESKLYSDLITKNQLLAIGGQAQVNLAQARLSALQRQGILTGEDARNQIRAQNAIIGLQIKQEQAQLKLIEAEAASLELQQEKIKVLQRLVDLGYDQAKAEYERQLAAAKRGSAEYIAAESALQVIEKQKTASKEQVEQQAKADREAIQRQKAIVAAQINAKRAAIAALAAGQTTSVEERAIVGKQDIANARTLASLVDEAKQFTIDKQLAEANILNFRKGGISSLLDEIKAVKASADLRIAAAKRENAFKVAELQLDINRAKVLKGTSSEQFQFLSELQRLTKERGIEEVASLEVQKEVNILEKIGIKNQADALQILQQSLDMYQRRVDLAREVADQESQIARNAAEIRILETGGEVDERTRLAFENEAAQIALQAAIQERDLKLQVIDVEYKLLEAQRAQTLAQLTLQETALRQLNTTQSNALADTLEKARSNISQIDMTAIKELQNRQAENTLVLAEQTAKKAGLAFRNSFFPENSAMTAFANVGERRASRGRAATPDITSTIKVESAAGNVGASIDSLKVNFEDLRSIATLTFSDIADVINTAASESLKQFEQLSAQASERLGQDFGPEGKIFTSLIGLTQVLSVTLPNTFKVLTTSFEEFKTKNAEALEGVKADTQKTIYTAQQLSAAFSAAAQVISGIASLIKSISDAKIAGVDKEIAAEQKRDGKSAESISKIEAMESKKDSIAKKSFNTQKKLMLAQAVMSTAAAVAGAYASLAMIPVVGPTLAGIAAGIIGAAGLAQIAIISGMQYGGGAAKSAAAPPSTLSIGKRSDSVDLARGPSANAGGEAGFIRGSQGMGSNASNFRTIGSAYGGDLMRGYGNRGFVVGEKGPEIITPETPISVTPANDAMAATPVNATFNIQALDASGVQDILVSQKGNIIKMIRDAANASGQGFLEDVNVNVYTRPSVNKL